MITLSDLTIAYALLPTFSLSVFADFVVITETISSFGAILIVTSVLTGPLLMAVIVPANELRALIFMRSLSLLRDGEAYGNVGVEASPLIGVAWRSPCPVGDRRLVCLLPHVHLGDSGSAAV